MTIITLAEIGSHRPCKSEYNRFAKDFPDGLLVTKEELLRVAELKYDIEWLARALLPAHLYEEYRRQRQAIDADYWRQREAIDAEFWRQFDTADAKDYWRQRETTYAEYRRQQALVLLRCLLKREGKED